MWFLNILKQWEWLNAECWERVSLEDSWRFWCNDLWCKILKVWYWVHHRSRREKILNSINENDFAMFSKEIDDFNIETRWILNASKRISKFEMILTFWLNIEFIEWTEEWHWFVRKTHRILSWFSNKKCDSNIDVRLMNFESFDVIIFDVRFWKLDIEFNIETKNRCWFVKWINKISKNSRMRRIASMLMCWRSVESKYENFLTRYHNHFRTVFWLKY